MKNILIVDDVEMNRKFMLPVFERDFRIFEAASGEKALAIMKSNHIDLVITDIFMEPIDGYTLIREIRKNEQTKTMPIIAITENDESSQDKAMMAGADRYIMRPLASDELRKATYKLAGQDMGRRDLIDVDFIFDSIPGAALVYKVMPDGCEILTCTRGLTTITGWGVDEFCKKVKEHGFKMTHPADAVPFKKMIERIVKTKSRGELIFRGYKKDGSEAWLWFQGQYIGEEDQFPLVEGVLLDVYSESNMYQSLLDESPSLVTVVDENSFEVLYANKTAKDTISLITSSDDYIGSVCYNHVFGLDSPCSFCIKNCTKEDYYINPELESQGKTYRQMFKKLKWHGRDALMEITMDITEQNQTVKQIEQQKEQQNLILDTIPAGIMEFCFKEDGTHIVSANKSIVEMMSFDKQKALGQASKNIIEMTHPDDLPIIHDVTNKLSVPGAYVEYEYRHFIRKMKAYRWILGQGRSILGSDGYVYAYISYTDITDRKEMELLKEKLQAAEIEATTKADFYSRMSHDMRTPMNGILGMAELSEEETDDAKLRENIGKIKTSGKYLLSLINDALDLQRIESGKMKLEPEIVRTTEVVENILDMVRVSAEAKGVELKCMEGNADLNWYIRADVLRLKQIFVNLLSNAIKFTPSGGLVEFEFKLLEREGMISHDVVYIRDSGIGMSKEFLETGIFKPFSQESNEVSSNYAGSGLGLSITKSLVELMGGKIEVESEIGVGTTFTVYIDFERVTKEEVEATLQGKKEHSDDISSKLEGRKILLAEDHPLNAEIAKKLLQKVGCEVTWAKNGQEAVSTFFETSSDIFDVILMDIRMPIMDGLEASRQIRALERADAKNIPIIAMTANAYEDDIKASFDAGINAHLAKPIEPKLFYDTIVKYLTKE